MHPAMALWLFSMVMGRIWQATLLGEEYRPGDELRPAKAVPRLVAVHAYLLTDLQIIRFPIFFASGFPNFIGRSEMPHSRSNSRGSSDVK